MARNEADNLKRIGIWQLKKFGYLNNWKSGSIQWENIWLKRTDSIGIEVSTRSEDSYIRFRYSQTEDNGVKKNFDYKAKLVFTNCHYSGKRWWFICPLIKKGVPCNRRVGILYKNGDYFGCRHCYDLTYKSKNENRRSKYYHLFRIMDAYQKVEEIREDMKRNFYKGKPTKKFSKLVGIFEKNKPYYDLLEKRKVL